MIGNAIGNFIGARRRGVNINWTEYWANLIPEFKIYAESLTMPLTNDMANALGNFYNDVITNAGITALSDLFDAVWMLQNETEESSFRNLVKNAHHLTKSGIVTFEQYVGVTGGGGYLDTNYNPNTEGVRYTQNNASIGFYSLSDKKETGTVEMGSRSVPITDILLAASRKDGKTYLRVNNAEAQLYFGFDTESVGLYIGTRDGANLAHLYCYKDKSLIVNISAVSGNTTSINNLNIYLLSLNNNGTQSSASTKTLQFAFAGKHITTAVRDVIVDALTTFRARLSILKESTFFNTMYDVLIVGAGAGGIGAAYALKDSGLNVAMIDQNTVLGGTHNAGMVIDFCESPDPGFFKEYIYDYLQPIGKCTTITDYWKSQMCYVRPSVDGTFAVNHGFGLIYFDRVELAKKYSYDFFGKINIRLQTKFISASSTSGECNSIIVRDLVTNKTHKISAKYFIDASGGILTKAINTVKGTDYFIGSDDKTKYNESCYPDGYEGDEGTISSIDLHYRILPDPTHIEDASTYPDVAGTGVATNGIRPDLSKTNAKIVFTDEGGNFDSTLLATTEPETLKANYENNVLSSWKIEKGITAGMADYMFDESAEMLAIREGWRINCDNMIKQDNATVRITSATDLAATKHIAVASWYFDFHGGEGATVSELNKLRVLPFGIPIGSLFPVGLKNVSIACRALGASHLGAAVTRVIKTMMSIGYAAGFIAEDYVNNSRTDQRDVPVTTIQTKVGIANTISYLENNCYGKSYDITWTP